MFESPAYIVTYWMRLLSNTK